MAAIERTEPDTWTLEQHSFDRERLLHYEGLFTLGSGLLHIRGSLEETLPGEDQARRYLRRPANVTSEQHVSVISHRGTYLPPVRADHPLLNSVIVNLPSPIGIELEVGGHRLHAESEELSHHRRWIDMRAATLEREIAWNIGGGVLIARFSRFVSRVEPNLLCQTVQLAAERTALNVRVRGTVDAAVTTNGYNHFETVDCREENGIVSVVATTTDSEVWVGSTLKVVGSAGATRRAGAGESGAWQEYSFRIEAGDHVQLSKLSLVSAAGVSNPGISAQSGRSLLRACTERSLTSLREEHEAAWEELWRDADVEIDGPDELQRALRFSIFSLLRSHRAGETSFAICPKGHAGEAYFGRYFWDTEIYLLPFFIHTDPDHARDLLRYRVQSLEGARANARRYGYRGAKYAWEADDRGIDHCPNWQYADHEIHVTADVAFGIQHYVAATGDEQFLFEEALPVLLEGARFWMDRIDTRNDEPVVFGVMGPDEYKPLSNNNAFTNRLAKFHLLYAAQSAQRCAESEPGTWAAHQRELVIGLDELSQFVRVGNALQIPYDRERGIIAQSEDFQNHLEVDVVRLRQDSGNRIGTGGVAAYLSQERLYRMKALKQADVVALLLLFPGETDARIAERSYRYYESITTHDSSLSASTHATVAAQLGLSEEAYSFLRQSLMVDVDAEAGDAGQGVHIANCGGNWQTVIYGFAGLRPAFATGEIELQPNLPADISRVSFPLRWRGARVSISITRKSVIIETRSAPIPATVQGERRLVEGKEEWHYAQKPV